MRTWCPLIPPEEYDRLLPFEEELPKIREAYDDWLASMRRKPFVGTTIGVLLDRIRMLMINIGIACAHNRELAETIQLILSEHIKRSALGIIDALPEKNTTVSDVKRLVRKFFRDLRFTRDVYPQEELEKASVILKASNDRPSVVGRFWHGFLGKTKQTHDAKNMEEIIQEALVLSSNVLKIVYMRLLSPNPWGTNSQK